MQHSRITSAIAFSGFTKIAEGPLEQVALAAKAVIDSGSAAPLLVFEAQTGRLVDLDFRGTGADVLGTLAPVPLPPGPGRPKLGVTAREITLLPRHWDWLAAQPGGASVTLRKLVEAARRDETGAQRLRQAQEAAYRFIHALAGDLPGFEAASRALFAGDGAGFLALTNAWPGDVRQHALHLAGPVFGDVLAVPAAP